MSKLSKMKIKKAKTQLYVQVTFSIKVQLKTLGLVRAKSNLDSTSSLKLTSYQSSKVMGVKRNSN